MNKETPGIGLWYTKGLGLIMVEDSGVWYSNQVGGVACLQQSQKGFYVPLNDESFDQERELSDFFTGPKWRGGCSDGIDIETADFIDSVLEKSICTRVLKVDRIALQDCHEAWIKVRINIGPEMSNESDYIQGFKSTEGILTWMNSD